MTRSIRTHLMLLLAVLLAAPAAHAQPLTEAVPDGVIAYLGWRGTDDMGPDYEGSNMQGVMEATGLLEAFPEMFAAYDSFFEGMRHEMGQEEAEALSAVAALGQSAWSHGGALYILGPEENGPPIPRVALLLKRGGDDEPETRRAMATLVEMINDAEEIPAFMGVSGEALFLSIGFDAGEFDGPRLSANADFTRAMDQVQADAAMTIYANGEELVGMVDGFVQMQQDEADRWGDEPDPFTAMWPTLREVSGLSGVKQIVMTAGLQDKRWNTQFFMDAPAPRVGFLSLIDNEPIGDATLLTIPKTATYAQVGTMDPARIMQVTRDVLGAIDPSLVEQMDGALAEANEATGVDLEGQLMAGLGPNWTMYIDPMISGNSMTSLVIVNELRDEDAVNTALMRLTNAANDAMDGVLEDMTNEELPMVIRFNSRQIDGRSIVSLGIPYISPSWAVHDGKLYIGLYPQALEMALEHSGEAEDSILANDAFIETMARFGDISKATSISFTDLPETAPDGYGINLLIAQSLTGGVEMMSGEASSFLLPPIGKLMPYIETAGSIAWVGDDGLHMRSIEPFPGSALLGPGKGAEGAMVVAVPLGVGVMLPALGSARQAAQQQQEMSQCRQITIGMHAYAADNRNEMPDDLAQLQDYVFWDSDSMNAVLISPRSMRAQETPLGFDDWDADRQARFIRENSSHVLIPVGSIDDIAFPSDTIVLFQRPDDARGWERGIAVGFADGHSEWFHDVEFAGQLIEEQTGQTMDELIERQVNFGQ